ncbi:hypothetical protein BGZ82_008535 [Podila clonocystis]|nr:hypothetical protein BGZ82_008535 [Podila clonocystis]
MCSPWLSFANNSSSSTTTVQRRARPSAPQSLDAPHLPDLREHIKEVNFVEPKPAVNTATTPTKTATTVAPSPVLTLDKHAQTDQAPLSDVRIRKTAYYRCRFDEQEGGYNDSHDRDNTQNQHNGEEDDNCDDHDQGEESLCSSLSSLSTQSEAIPAHITRVRRLDPYRDRDKFQSTVDHFLAMWVKDNATAVTVESVLEVCSNQQAKFKAYKTAIAISRHPECYAERVLYHGTNSSTLSTVTAVALSCQGRHHYALQGSYGNNDVLQQLCYKTDCATCGILAYGFDLSRTGQGSRDRGARVWQRFGDGIYFSPNSSKCHFYSKTGNTGYHPTTKKNFGTMIVAKVVLGKPYNPQSAGKAEEAWTAPPAGYDSVVARAGDGIVVYEENVVYAPAACLPTAIITYSFTSTTEYC